ncbi:MAG: hypothetical protein J6M47_07225 [Clostridia bacterium]|nr:hypothetical protein [Clostridia bacterium]
MRAGYGKSELTPPMGVELAGYGYYLGRCAQSVRDPLYARAMMIENGALRTLIICCDLLGLSRAVCGAVFAHARTLGVPEEHILIVSIHTHTGPTIKYHEGCGFVSDDYVATVAPAICRAVDAAAADLDDVNALEYICAPFEGDHIYNRTIKDGPVDRHVRGFLMTRAEKADIAVVSAACHGVFRGRVTAVSADFAGEICRRLDAQGLCSLYLNGLCGDIDPTKQDDALLDSFAALVVSRFNESKKPLPTTLSAGSFPFTLRLTPVKIEDIREAAAQAAARAGGEAMPAARVARTWEREMLEKFARLSETEDIVTKYILLGGVPVMALPFEGFTQIGMDIRRICGREDALVLGCAEELLGYLPTKGDIARGTYAALESTFLYKRLPVVPGEAERLGEEMGFALERVLS